MCIKERSQRRCACEGGLPRLHQISLGVFAGKHTVRTTISYIRWCLKNDHDVNELSPLGETPVLYAVESGKVAIVTFLIKAGANITIADINGVTPLHRAAYYGMDKIVTLLLSNGADINARTIYGETPLMYAIERRENHIAHLLIAAGADLGASNPYGTSDRYYNYSPLHIAAYYCNESMVQFLAPHYDIDLSTPEGRDYIEGIAAYVAHRTT